MAGGRMINAQKFTNIKISKSSTAAHGAPAPYTSFPSASAFLFNFIFLFLRCLRFLCCALHLLLLFGATGATARTRVAQQFFFYIRAAAAIPLCLLCQQRSILGEFLIYFTFRCALFTLFGQVFHFFFLTSHFSFFFCL